MGMASAYDSGRRALGGHNRGMRLVVVVTVALAATLGAGCRSGDDGAANPPAAFCEAAAKYEDRLVNGADIDEQIRLVRRMVETAPAEIKPDTQTFLAALEAVRDDPEDRGDAAVQEAVENVNRYATSGCDLLEQDGGGGSPI
jgi:hypothetical protein